MDMRIHQPGQQEGIPQVEQPDGVAFQRKGRRIDKAVLARHDAAIAYQDGAWTLRRQPRDGQHGTGLQQYVISPRVAYSDRCHTQRHSQPQLYLA
jgi:hypothetical protein